MKLQAKVGDRARVLQGKFRGKEAVIQFIDRKTGRVRLEGLKISKSKLKGGKSKELHGTLHISSLSVIKPEAPAAEAAAAPAAS